MADHWMAFVKWATIVKWKRDFPDAATRAGAFPYQYSSDDTRFLKVRPGDVLWLVSTPRFGAKGNRTLRGRARPPAVMARIRVSKLCCNHDHERCRKRKGKKPVCIGTSLPSCDKPGVLPNGVHKASDAWSIMIAGEPDPDGLAPLKVTYPVLYNFFGVLDRLRFETAQGETDLNEYLAFVESGQYFTPAQLKSKQAGKEVKNPGPYAAFGQHFQTLRKLTPKAAKAMNEIHTRAVKGKRIFFSYKWADVESFANLTNQSRHEWTQALNRGLEQAGYSSWLDDMQIPADGDIGGLLEEVLSDAVRQSVIFVVLLSENYGKRGWTRKEWDRACALLADEERKHRLLRVVLECGGDPARLRLRHRDALSIASPPTPAEIVQAIRAEVQARTSSPE